MSDIIGGKITMRVPVSDIVERLASMQEPHSYALRQAAIDEIERLRARVDPWPDSKGNNIVERLRYFPKGSTEYEAADEIELLCSLLAHADEWRGENIRVWAEVERLKAALREVADAPGVSAADGYDEMQHIARAALARREGKP